MKFFQYAVVAAIGFTAPMASASSLVEASAMFDQMDREELLEALDKASACIEQHAFDCASQQLKAAKGFINSDADRKLWELVDNADTAERKIVREESEAEERAEREELEWEREQERRAERAADREAERWQEGYRMAHAMLAPQTHLTPDQKEQIARAAGGDMVSGGTSNISAAGQEINDGLRERLAQKQERLEQLREDQQRQRMAQRAEQQRMIEQRRREASQATSQARQLALASAQQAGGSALAGAQVAQAAPQVAAQETALKTQREAQQKKTTEAAAQLAATEKLRKEADDKAQKEAETQARAQAKADKAAAKKAEQEAQEQAKLEYLRQITQQTRMGAMNCYGEYHVVSNRPQPKPELVVCVDIRFRASCPDGRSAVEGVAKNVVGMGTGCFGDTTQIQKLDCDAKEIRVQALESRSCQGFN
jgi:hypothetical protein